ncbi:50S ribosome-binding GTPase [Natroniella sulfidigena]|uniref:GTPase n=1 Tax=Natroniella sulfidigena TaxID=723921 RepID=UPI00200B081C|nr:GTPase [Natroniella sulfidigena]MCK8817691.1 50S ribosome-binding GTPase [Natroniella sulfidigena]
MMVSVLIVGQPNVGKTSFAINFANYLGVKKLKLLVRQPAGFMATKTYQLEEAYEELVAVEPHKTTEVQSIQLKLPIGKQDKKIRLIDSCGLVDEIHSKQKIRTAMAQTLNQLFQSQIILHMIDLSQFDFFSQLKKIDQELYNLFHQQPGYKILANKLDLDHQKNNLTKLESLIEQKLIIAISALYQQGFTEVKTFLLKNV